jgi:hypothetical protein
MKLYHLVEDETKCEEYTKQYNDLIAFINKENGCFNKLYDRASEKLQMECYNNNRFLKQSRNTLKQRVTTDDDNNAFF